jgi:hypothetical protein
MPDCGLGMVAGRSNKNIRVSICLIFIILCFAYSVFLRRPWFARGLDVHHEWVTAHSVCVTNNWLKEGALNLRFLQVIDPDSVEFDTLLKRRIYVSYPAGAFIPVFLIAKIFNIKDLIVLYQSYNLLNHLLIAIILFLLMFEILNHFARFNRLNIIFALGPSLVYLFTPPTLYWHQNVFFADEAVMIFFVAFVYLEIRRFLYGRHSLANKLVFYTIVFLGTLTDWLFLFIVFIAIILRWLFSPAALRFSPIRDSIIPPSFAIAIFSW